MGEVIKDYYLTQILKRIEGSTTQVPDRIENLLNDVFDRTIDKKVFDLRYQLLHAIAGTVAEANKRNIGKAIFVVNTFCTNDNKCVNIDNYQRNKDDLNQFIKYLSFGGIKNIESNSLIGPFNTKSNDFLSNEVDLYIMKVESTME